MTIDEMRKTATEAGNRYMLESGEVPEPGKKWTMNAVHASMAEMHRLARLHKINLFKLPGGK